MATCLHCPNELTGRCKVCPSCKARVERKPSTRAKPTRATKKTAAKKPPAKKATKKPPTKRTTKVVPEGLARRGAQLWTSLSQLQGTAAGELALEACRMADRLEELDSVLRGGPGWIYLVEQVEGSGIAIVKVDKALDQSRVLAIAFKQLLSELGVTVVPALPDQPANDTPANPLDELNRRREAKKVGSK